MKNRRLIPAVIYLLLLISVFSWAGELFGDESSQLPYSQVVELFRNEQVKAFEIQDDTIAMELYTPIDGETVVRAKLAYPETFLREMSELLRNAEKIMEVKDSGDSVDIYGTMSKDGDRINDIIIHVPEDCTFVCFFGNIRTEDLGDIVKMN